MNEIAKKNKKTQAGQMRTFMHELEDRINKIADMQANILHEIILLNRNICAGQAVQIVATPGDTDNTIRRSPSPLTQYFSSTDFPAERSHDVMCGNASNQAHR